MTFSLRNLGLVFPDYGAKLRGAVFALSAIFGGTIENVSYRNVSGIASAFEKAVSVERLLYLVSMRLDDVGELLLGLIVITENMVKVFADVRG